ncbi:MAG: hypothetical protein HQ445_09860 [Polaromonas sp.]|nr:hypothetical protein [Polaromonas sp.]
MLVFDFLTAGSPSAIFAVAAAGTAGVAAAGFAGAAGATGPVAGAAVGAVLGATVVCADATQPALASRAKIRVFFNMSFSKSMAKRPR